ncbi:MAG: DUF1549 domain-containing protein, partial [Verrucomicrobiota bacterium]
RSASIFVLAIPALTQAEIDFAHEIVPIIKQHCAECHAGEEKKGGFSMNTRQQLLEGSEYEENVVLIGDAEKSWLYELITTDDGDIQMPPSKKGRMTPEQIAKIKAWITEGLAWEPGFTFGESAYEPPLKPREVELPPVVDGRQNPIDRILDAYLAANDVERPQPLEDAAFLRRLHLDTIGLLPDAGDLDWFVGKNDPNKRVKAIEAALSDNIGYADHWLTFWNDLLRNDYTGTGFITGGRFQITSWLYAALLENKPFDEFTRELIAPPKDDSSGFIKGITWRGDINSSQTVQVQFAQNLSQVFLGINMKCASCHDSFIDRWKLEEAYSLAAIYATQPLEIHRCDKPTGEMAKAAWIFPEIGEIDPAAAQPERLKQLSQLMTHPDNGRFTRTIVNRIWQRLMGRGIVHPVDAMHTEPWSHDLLDFLAADFAEHGYNLKHTISMIVSSQAYQSRAVVLKEDPGENYVYAGPIAKRMTAEQFLDAVWSLTNTHPQSATAKVFRVPDGGKKVEIYGKWIWRTHTAPPAAGEKQTFRKVINLNEKPNKAQMVITCDNEYRLIVNVKQRGLDKTWETAEIIDITASLKAGENIILVVGKNGGNSPNLAALFAEIHADGKLIAATDETWEWTPRIATKDGGFANVPTWEKSQVIPNGPWNRSVENPLNQVINGGGLPVRASLVANDFLMRSLGRPHREQVVTTRPEELTTLQAIDLANGDILAKTLKRGAENLAGKDELPIWLYRSALSRDPNLDEAALLQQLLGESPDYRAVEDLLWSVVMLPEFQMIR